MNDQTVGDQGRDQRVVRHHLIDRVYHWVMAASVLTLLGTGFLPIVGVKFPWVTVHWIAGLVLAAAVLFHIVRALFWQDRASMGFGRLDLERSHQSIAWAARRRRQPPDRPGKYPLPQKIYHHGIAVLVLVTIATGLIMMVKIDTPFWTRDPYFISSQNWGIVFVLHGLAALAVLSMVIVHIYFAIRPEKLWITRSMIKGWITRREYETHHDPRLWEAEPADGSRSSTSGADRQDSREAL